MTIKQLIISTIIFLLLDSIYLTTFSNFFNNVVYKVQGKKIKFNIFGAMMCYILLIYGLNYFIISHRKSLIDAFILGIVIYGVYETTNYTLFENWSPLSVIIDTLWGGILFTLTAYFSYTLLKKV
jgi:uncharacterized membrane protein